MKLVVNVDVLNNIKDVQPITFMTTLILVVVFASLTLVVSKRAVQLPSFY